jgi:hypothetical protein
MKKILFLSPILLLLFGFTAGYVVDEKVNKLLQQFQMSEEMAKAGILNAVSNSSYVIPNVKTLKNVSMEERISIIKLMGENIKAYLVSKEFIEKYNQYREDRKPKAPEAPKSSAQLKDEQRESLKNSIAEIEKNKAQAAKDQQAMFDNILKGFNQQLQEIENPKNTIYSPEMDTFIKQSYDMQMNEYAKNVATWENSYPIDNPRPMIKKWVTAFLDKSAGINFDAKLTEIKGGKVKFVDPEYEGKDSQWKLYFRAGKETVTSARAFAEEWLTGLK